MSQPAELFQPPKGQKAHARVAACSVFSVGGHACGYSPSSQTHASFWTYSAQVARLAEIFPHGRFKRDVDGTAILVPRSRRWAGCHLYEQAPGRLVGLFYVGNCRRVTQGRLAAYVVRHLGGDGEGIVHLRWDPELARVLATFSRGTQRGTRFFRKRAAAVATDRKASIPASGAGDPPPVAPDQGAFTQEPSGTARRGRAPGAGPGRSGASARPHRKSGTMATEDELRRVE